MAIAPLPQLDWVDRVDRVDRVDEACPDRAPLRLVPPSGAPVGGFPTVGLPPSRRQGVGLPTRRRVRRRVSARVRRRRLAVVVTAAGVAAAFTVPVGSLLGQGRPAPSFAAAVASALPTATRAGQGTYYVVRRGDTVASIAARVSPSHPGPVAAWLAAQLGSSHLVVGEHIPLTTHAGPDGGAGPG